MTRRWSPRNQFAEARAQADQARAAMRTRRLGAPDAPEPDTQTTLDEYTAMVDEVANGGPRRVLAYLAALNEQIEAVQAPFIRLSTGTESGAYPDRRIRWTCGEAAVTVSAASLWTEHAGVETPPPACPRHDVHHPVDLYDNDITLDPDAYTARPGTVRTPWGQYYGPTVTWPDVGYPCALCWAVARWPWEPSRSCPADVDPDSTLCVAHGGKAIDPAPPTHDISASLRRAAQRAGLDLSRYDPPGPSRGLMQTITPGFRMTEV